MKVYRGWRVDCCRTTVSVGDYTGTKTLRSLPGQPGQDVAPFNWGTGGPGDRRLALALLYDVTGQKRCAECYADHLVEELLVKLDRRHWCLTGEQLLTCLVEQILKDTGMVDADDGGIYL